MDQLLNRFLLHANALDRTMGQPRFGLVSSYNPATHSAKVVMQPQGDTPVQSGWLPICTPHLGNGWGIVAAPEIGEQVVIIADSGDANHGIILGSVFSGPSKPPSPNVQSRELALVHQSGSSIRLSNDGSIQLNTAVNVHISAAANVTLATPSVVTTGNLAVGTGATGSFGTSTGQTVTVQDGIVIAIV